MSVIFIRTLIIFTVLLVLIRLMGKRQIGEMQPFEFIVTLIIADLACFPLADVSIPLIYGLAAMICLFILHQILSILEQNGNFFKRIISGKPSLVINKSGVDVLELKRNNLGVDDLIESIRANGYLSLDQIDYAVFESNGKLSTMEKQDSDKCTSLAVLVVDQGKINQRNIDMIKADKSHLDNFFRKNSTSIKQVEVMTIDGDGRVYLKEKGKSYRILNFALKGGVKW